MKIKNRKIIIPIVIVAALFLFPLMSPDAYFLSFLFTLFVYIALSESWNLIGGYAGYLSFGHVAFFGVGAYTAALLLIHFGLSPFYTCFVGGILAAILAAIFGYPCLRLKGPYFCIASLCLGLIMRLITINLDFTGAMVGLWLPLPPSNAFFYEFMLALSLIIVLLTRRIEGTKFGLGLRSIREDEETAQTVGINATRLKLTALILSAFLVGIVGSIYAYYRTFIHPDHMFDTYMSIIIVVMALLGGSKSWLGPVIGAIIVTVIDQLLVAFTRIPSEACRMIFGLLLIFVIIFMPDGIASFITGRRTPKKKEIST